MRILRDVNAEQYGFKMVDLVVAVMLKAYLQEMVAEEVLGLLSRIVSPGMRSIRGGTVKRRGLEQSTWITINGAELASLIESARAAAAISAESWRAQEGEALLKKTIEYMKDDVLPGLSGKRYVASMPVEMAEFITDCWLAVA